MTKMVGCSFGVLFTAAVEHFAVFVAFGDDTYGDVTHCEEFWKRKFVCPQAWPAAAIVRSPVCAY